MKRKRAKQSRRPRLKGPIHERIKRLRDERGLTQEALADAVGVDKTAVCHWENHVARPDLNRLSLVAEVLGISVPELIAGEKAFDALGQMIEDSAA